MSIKVLVVTNDHALARDVGAFLGHAVEVKAVATQQEALDCAIRACPDVVLLDHDATGVDCLDIVAIMRALRCRFECALLTARPSDRLASEAARNGVTHLLIKPVGRDELQALIGIRTSASVHLLGRGVTAPAAAH